jgi:hypothetical protein
MPIFANGRGNGTARFPASIFLSFWSGTITYARSRLWLGVSGVGTIVVISTFLIATGLPIKWLPTGTDWTGADLVSLLAAICVWVIVSMPLDLLGGYLLPNRFRSGTISWNRFAQTWFRGVLAQATIYFLVGLLILTAGRGLGLGGAALAVVGISLSLITFQLPTSKLMANLSRNGVDAKTGSATSEALIKAIKQTQQWGWQPAPIEILRHRDTGFTGGIVGLPGREKIVLPLDWVSSLTPSQLAIIIARRQEAIVSGARTRGVGLALIWVVVGFCVSSLIPGASAASVGGLVMTVLGFTLWTFLGLLTLPTLSRQSSYAIDRKVIQTSDAETTFNQVVKTLDRAGDDEPQRPAWIETIFHPVPSVENRTTESQATVGIAWHAARITLFVSWACMGLLVRAVHCNAGRPELWVMLPTD